MVHLRFWLFFDINKTLAELKNIHGAAIRTLFKELFNKETNDWEATPESEIKSQEVEDEGIKISKEKLVIVGDSLFGDISSGYRFKENGEEVFIKGILVLKDMNELQVIKNQIEKNSELKKIIQNIDTEAFIVDNVKTNVNGASLIMGDKKNFLIKL